MLHFFAAKSFLCLAAYFNPFWTSICLTMCALRWFFHNYAFPRLDSFCVASSWWTELFFGSVQSFALHLPPAWPRKNGKHSFKRVTFLWTICRMPWIFLSWLEERFNLVLLLEPTFTDLFDITETFDHNFFLNVAVKSVLLQLLLYAHTHTRTY